jgi:hypothetical protein
MEFSIPRKSADTRWRLLRSVKLQAIAGRLEGQFAVPAFAAVSLLAPEPIVRSSNLGFEGTAPGASVNSIAPPLAGPLPLAAPTDESATDVAFALHLTPRSVIGKSPTPWAASLSETKSSVLAATTTRDEDISKVLSSSVKAEPRLDLTIEESISPIKLSGARESAGAQESPAILAPQWSVASLSGVGLAHAAPLAMADTIPLLKPPSPPIAHRENLDSVLPQDATRSKSPEGEYSRQDFVRALAAQKADPLVANPISLAGLDVTRELHKASMYEQATTDSLARQSLALGEPAIPRSPDGASLECPPEGGPSALTTLGEGEAKQLTIIRHASLSIGASMSDKAEAVAPNQQEGSPEERNNSDPGSKVFKPDGPGKPPANQKDFHGQGSNLPAGGSPALVNGQGRISPRTQPTVDPPTPARPSLETEPTLPLRPQPIREISLRLIDDASSKVEIQVLERGGNLHVAVRTPDQELTKSLQTNLGELVGRFETKGYRTETWIPAASLHAGPQLTETTSNSGHSQDQSEHAGSWSGQRQQQNQHESDRRQHPRWMASVEEMFDEEKASTSGFRMENQ